MCSYFKTLLFVSPKKCVTYHLSAVVSVSRIKYRLLSRKCVRYLRNPRPFPEKVRPTQQATFALQVVTDAADAKLGLGMHVGLLNIIKDINRSKHAFRPT